MVRWYKSTLRFFKTCAIARVFKKKQELRFTPRQCLKIASFKKPLLKKAEVFCITSTVARKTSRVISNLHLSGLPMYYSNLRLWSPAQLSRLIIGGYVSFMEWDKTADLTCEVLQVHFGGKFESFQGGWFFVKMAWSISLQQHFTSQWDLYFWNPYQKCSWLMGIRPLKSKENFRTCISDCSSFIGHTLRCHQM